MAHPDESAAARRGLGSEQLVRRVRAGQVDPADHAGDQWLRRGQGQQFPGFRGAGHRLHHDDPVLAGRAQIRGHVVQAERALQHRQAVGPRLRPGGQIPHVHVRVQAAPPAQQVSRLCHGLGRSRSPPIPPSTASSVPVVDPAAGEAR